MPYISIDIAKVAALGDAVCFGEDAIFLGKSGTPGVYGGDFSSRAWMREILGVDFGLEVTQERHSDKHVFEVIGQKWSLIFDYGSVGSGPNPWRGNNTPSWATGFPQNLVDAYRADAAKYIDFQKDHGVVKRAFFIGDYNSYAHDMSMTTLLVEYPGKIMMQAMRLRKKRYDIYRSFFGKRYYYA